ncbi:MAG TPA: TraB/GumN family protein, partial [Chitinophagaceae bacterium]|nr:TraB/GumN family protein [Chitinophagaceae bacterium]
MKRLTLLLLCAFSVLFIQAQTVKKEKKYPSLLWEITGNGTKKPSYLIGTMHVSSKMAFNLPDSFYLAVKSAQVVALETNPETWQEDMNKYDLDGVMRGGYNRWEGSVSGPSDYLNIKTLKFFKYDGKLERSMFSNPSAINNLLYRSYGNESADFEEDTYLDMYIYQCGKKWGKNVAGVEDYGESMRLMMEAYKDAAKEKNRKERSYGDMDEAYSADKLQEAYRKGDLDLLDSINTYNSVSAAFDEKFLYRRNEIQAESIDSIIKSGSILFVGVGAAHLPGDRGVIEMLRAKGYKLRPVKMGERASKTKEQVDKLRVPVVFKTIESEDGFYKVDIPGKFYKYGEDGALDQQQYADMANGSYYMVTRVMTNAWLWNNNTEDVLKKVDSLLYENIPGKIISKTPVLKNGYKGYDIVNRTRRGDLQRYHIFVTPFEVLFFKMSGNSDYVKGGDEARRFFGSIQLKEYKPAGEPAGNWKKFSPVYGGFAVELPHLPFTGNDGSWIYDAEDKSTATQYRVIRTDIHNYGFAEEDTFDLALMEESFMASEFIDSALQRKQTNYKGYPALEARYRDKQGGLFDVRYLIQGPHYYTLVAHGKQEQPEFQRFFQSFDIKPLQYKAASVQKDTALYFSVQTPVFPENKKIKLDIGSEETADEEDEETEAQLLENGAYRGKLIENDTTGEKIHVAFYKSSRYHYSMDSSRLTRDRGFFYQDDSTWIIRNYKKTTLPGNRKVWDILVSDTGSSRAIWFKAYYKDGVTFTLTSLTDTLTPPSDFVRQFYETFTPADTLNGINPFAKKSALFFGDLRSKDSVIRKKALNNISEIYLDSTDLPELKRAILACNWEQKKYLNTKKELIGKLGEIKTRASADYLRELYYSLGDTVQLVYPVLRGLLLHRNEYAYELFRTIIASEPPVLDFSDDYDYSYNYARTIYSINRDYGNGGYGGRGNFLDRLSDTLELTKKILPDLLPLLNLEDYKSPIMDLLGEMVDSNLLRPSDYVMYYNKFLLEAKQELKKQSIAEKKAAIQKAEASKEDNKGRNNRDDEEDDGNDLLTQYAQLLIPFWDSHPAVSPLISQMLASKDK